MLVTVLDNMGMNIGRQNRDLVVTSYPYFAKVTDKRFSILNDLHSVSVILIKEKCGNTLLFPTRAGSWRLNLKQVILMNSEYAKSICTIDGAVLKPNDEYLVDQLKKQLSKFGINVTKIK